MADKKIEDYKCGWCGNRFKARADTFAGSRKHNKVSTQIACPRCGNFIPTWED